MKAKRLVLRLGVLVTKRTIPIQLATCAVHLVRRCSLDGIEAAAMVGEVGEVRWSVGYRGPGTGKGFETLVCHLRPLLKLHSGSAIGRLPGYSTNRGGRGSARGLHVCMAITPCGEPNQQVRPREPGTLGKLEDRVALGRNGIISL